MAQAKSQVKWPGKTQARAKDSESGFSKLKPGPQATLGHPFGSGLAWLLMAGFGWLLAHGLVLCHGRDVLLTWDKLTYWEHGKESGSGFWFLSRSREERLLSFW